MKLIVSAIVSLSLIALAGCNTVKGLGQDIESVGEAGDREI